MNEYVVQWTIDVSAENPWEAARLAHEIMMDHASTATCFMVKDEDGEAFPIDTREV